MSRRRRRSGIKSLVGSWRGEQVARENLQDRLSALPDEVLVDFLRQRGYEPANRGHALLLIVRQFPREAEELLRQGASGAFLSAREDTVSDTVDDTVADTGPVGPDANSQSVGRAEASTGEEDRPARGAVEQAVAGPASDTAAYPGGDTAADAAADTVADTASDTVQDAPSNAPLAAARAQEVGSIANEAGRATPGDTVSDTVADTAADTEADTVVDTAANTAEDTVADTAVDTGATTVSDTMVATASKTVATTAADTVADTTSDTAADTVMGDASAATARSPEAGAGHRAAAAGKPPARGTGPRRSRAPSDSGGEEVPPQMVLPGETEPLRLPPPAEVQWLPALEWRGAGREAAEFLKRRARWWVAQRSAAEAGATHLAGVYLLPEQRTTLDQLRGETGMEAYKLIGLALELLLYEAALRRVLPEMPPREGRTSRVLALFGLQARPRLDQDGQRVFVRLYPPLWQAVERLSKASHRSPSETCNIAVVMFAKTLGHRSP